ncbi:MAG: malate synthase G, partial [Sedimenticolaceae bacterium]|nr:malate synthase G [Sedimenticolaceae bacterium]
MSNRVSIGNLEIARELHDLVAGEIAPGTGVEPAHFWQAFESIIADLGPKNRALLERRDAIQARLDTWHREHRDHFDFAAYKDFLVEIGYLLPEGEDFTIETRNVDPEISTVAGPQLVVPVNNARYALNAANARWGSLYDALYGTDAIPESEGLEKGASLNRQRAARVIHLAAEFLDEAVPLAAGSHADATAYLLTDMNDRKELVVTLASGDTTSLADPEAFVGYRGGERPELILLRHNGLHIELRHNPDNPVGKLHPAGISDVVLEAAVSTIQDCEDSVAAVDAEDKVLVYRNWLGLMKGDLEETFYKQGKELTRRMNPDRSYVSPDGGELNLPGRSLMLIRNVGHLMTNSAVLFNGEEVPEGIMDAMITNLIAMHDLNRTGTVTNSRTGSIYIVKPKMHGPEEV